MTLKKWTAVSVATLLALGAIVAVAATPAAAGTADSIMGNAKAANACPPGQSRYTELLYKNPNRYGDCASGYRRMGGGIAGSRCVRRVSRCGAGLRVN